MKNLFEIVYCPSEPYEGYYEIFRQYAREAPEWVNFAEDAFIENGFFDGLCLQHSFKSKNEHIDVRFDDCKLENPSETIGYKKAKEVIELRMFTQLPNLGSSILYMIHPRSKNLENYLNGFKTAWLEGSYKTPILVVAPE